MTFFPGEWRTKALVNRVLGVRSPIALNVLIVLFKATLDMQADCRAKYMSAKVLKRQREFVGCVPTGVAPEGAGPGA